MSEAEIALAMRRFAQKVQYVNAAESSEKEQAKPQLKNDIAAVAALGTIATVSSAGLASGGAAVAGSGLYFGRRRFKQAYNAFVPQEYKDKIEGFISEKADKAVIGAQNYLADIKKKQDE